MARAISGALGGVPVRAPIHTVGELRALLVGVPDATPVRLLVDDGKSDVDVEAILHDGWLVEGGRLVLWGDADEVGS